MVTTNAAVYSDGSVYWNAPAIYTSSCKIDVSYFPFDEQICTLQFGSWAYNGLQVDLTNRSSAGDTSAYIDSGEWELVGMPVVRHVVYYACCEAPYPDLRFHILIRRRPLFYMFNLLVPCFLISMITALGFYMPADSGEKVTLGITILLALTVFLLLVAETMPPQSEVVPLIGRSTNLVLFPILILPNYFLFKWNTCFPMEAITLSNVHLSCTLFVTGHNLKWMLQAR